MGLVTTSGPTAAPRAGPLTRPSAVRTKRRHHTVRVGWARERAPASAGTSVTVACPARQTRLSCRANLVEGVAAGSASRQYSVCGPGRFRHVGSNAVPIRRPAESGMDAGRDPASVAARGVRLPWRGGLAQLRVFQAFGWLSHPARRLWCMAMSVVSLGAVEVIEALAALVGRLDAAVLSGSDAAELTGLFARGTVVCHCEGHDGSAGQPGPPVGPGRSPRRGGTGWPSCRAAAPERPEPVWPWPSRWTPSRNWRGPVRPAPCHRLRRARSRLRRPWIRAALLV